MKESYREGIASHSGLEPYAGEGNLAGVASARGNAGRRLSSEIITSVCRSCPDLEKAISTAPLLARCGRTRRSLRTCCMRGHSKCENRESLLVSAGQGGMVTAQRNGQETFPMVMLT